jgi:ADP-ribose pyrophosphatase YjhB (NUDIX family)
LFSQCCTRRRPDPWLIRRTDNDLYSIPGGGLELNETLTETVRREVLVETSINVQVTGLIGIYSDPEHVIEFTDGEVRQEFYICFRATPTGGDRVQATNPMKSSGLTRPTSTG